MSSQARKGTKRRNTKARPGIAKPPPLLAIEAVPRVPLVCQQRRPRSEGEQETTGRPQARRQGTTEKENESNGRGGRVGRRQRRRKRRTGRCAPTPATRPHVRFVSPGAVASSFLPPLSVRTTLIYDCPRCQSPCRAWIWVECKTMNLMTLPTDLLDFLHFRNAFCVCFLCFV